jgi:hypothetical protein
MDVLTLLTKHSLPAGLAHFELTIEQGEFREVVNDLAGLSIHDAPALAVKVPIAFDDHDCFSYS